MNMLEPSDDRQFWSLAIKWLSAGGACISRRTSSIERYFRLHTARDFPAHARGSRLSNLSMIYWRLHSWHSREDDGVLKNSCYRPRIRESGIGGSCGFAPELLRQLGIARVMNTSSLHR